MWRVSTADGRHFAKQNCALQSFEAGLVSRLARWSPGHLVPVAAVDEDRGLLLTADLGPVFSETAGHDLSEWGRVVAAGAELQRSVAPYTGEMVDLGVTRLAAIDAAAYVEARVGQLASLPRADSRALPAEDARRLLGHVPKIQEWADTVASLGLPLTLLHNDLHADNVVAGPTLRFFDFGDALLAEPLSVMLIPLSALGRQLGAGPDDPRLTGVVEAYLEVCSDLVPLRGLRAAVPAALALGKVARLESWVRVCASMHAAELRSEGRPFPPGRACSPMVSEHHRSSDLPQHLVGRPMAWNVPFGPGDRGHWCHDHAAGHHPVPRRPR